MKHIFLCWKRSARLVLNRSASFRVAFAMLFFACCATTVHASEAASFWVHRPESRAAKPTLAAPRNASAKNISRALTQGQIGDNRATQNSEQVRPTASTSASKPSVGNASGAHMQHSIAESLAIGSNSPWAVVTGLTLLTLVPAILLAMTPLVRLLVVFHFLRQALGTQTAPSNQILMGLGLMMTWFLMQPVITEVQQQAIAPYRAGMLDGEAALAKGAEPVRHFMLRYARDKDLELFSAAALPERLRSREDAPMSVVVPAYMISELKSGFQIGAILFLPFLLIDLVVASVTTSIGMVQLPPVVISTPVKILLFVMVDGWHLLVSSLLKSF